MWLWERYRPDVTGGNNCRLVLADTGRLIAMMPYTEYRERGISGQTRIGYGRPGAHR